MTWSSPSIQENGVERSLMSDECEQQLVERIQARRDAEAFKQLYSLYLPRVHTYLSYRVGRWQDAEDLTSEVFLRVVEGLVGGSFAWRHQNSFAAWVFRIAHNLVSRFHRDARAGQGGHPVPLDELPPIAANDLLPEDALLRKEVFQQLHRLVNDLPERKREVVSLRYFAGLRNREIAQVLGIDERTVASTLSRALDELETGLQADGKRL